MPVSTAKSLIPILYGSIGNLCLDFSKCVAFEKKDYPGYENKRGDGSRCDRTFILGDCSTFKFHVAKELYTENMKWRQVNEGESKQHRQGQLLECSNRVSRVSSEIHIGELGRISPRERTRFPHRYTQESAKRHRRLCQEPFPKGFHGICKVKGRKMLIRNRYSPSSTGEKGSMSRQSNHMTN